MNFYCEKCDVCMGDDGNDSNVINAPSQSVGLCEVCEDEKERKEERKKKFKAYLEFHDEVIDVAREWIEEFGYGYGLIFDIEVYVNNETYPPVINAEYSYESQGSCGATSQLGNIAIPLSALWDDEAFERERKKREDANLAAREKQKEKDAKKARLDKATRYEQYLDLCKEFDDNS